MPRAGEPGRRSRGNLLCVRASGTNRLLDLGGGNLHDPDTDAWGHGDEPRRQHVGRLERGQVRERRLRRRVLPDSA
ncbi:MAG: hypothetical protein AAF170_12810 [Bacteroidota bacterium]